MARADVRLRRGELQAITDYAEDFIALFDLEFRHLFVNRAIAGPLGREPEEFAGKTMADLGMAPDVIERIDRHLRLVAATGNAETFEHQMALPHGRRHLHTMLAPVKRRDGSLQAIIAISRDVTEWKRADALRGAQNEVMRAIAGGSGLPELMAMIVQLAEANAPGRRCSLLLADAEGRRLRPGCAPHLPESLVTALCGPIAPDNGSCGAAAAARAPHVSADAQGDPVWVRHRGLLQRHGIGACWSQPILAQDGRLLGTFAMYAERAQPPAPFDLGLAGEAALLASVAIHHRRTLDTLLEVSERYAALTEHAANIISVTDLGGTVLETSPAIQAILGYEPGEIVGTDAYRFVHPDDQGVAREAFRRLRERVGTEAAATYRYRHKDGSWRVLETMAKSRFNHRGDYIAVINSRDVTDHQRMTEALRLSEARLERALEASDLGMWDWDTGSGELYLDKNFTAIMGYGSAGGPRRIDWLLEQIHADDRPRLQAAFIAHFKGQTEHCEFEYRARSTAGEWKWIHARGQVTARNADGWALRISGTNRDVTATRHLQDRLERALSASGLGLWDWDVKSGRLFADERCRGILEYAADAFGDGVAFLESITHPGDAARNAEAIAAHARGETPYYEVEVRARTADGRWKWVRSRGQVTVRDEHGEPLHITGTIQDIDDTRRVQERLDRANRRIQLLLEATDEGIVGLDAGGAVSFVNPAATRILGQPGEAMLGRPLLDLVSHVRENGAEVPPEETPAQRCLALHTRQRSGEDLFWRRGTQVVPVEYSVSPLLLEEVLHGAVLIVHDVSEKRSMAHQLQFQALHDPLTGLINRRGFETRLNELLASAKAESREHALAYIDLDQFKLVNDTCGHAAGDELLRQLPKVLQPLVRARDVIARLGGDEFAVLLHDCPLGKAAQVAESVRDAIRSFRFVWQYRTFTIGASIGVVGITAESQGLVSVLGAADTACYVAKDQGPNHVHVSYPHDLAIIRRRGEMRWIARLKNALEDDRFTLYFQSIASFEHRGHSPTHHELLIRLLDAKGEVILPGAFIAAAERYQLMPVIDAWVVEHALRFIGESIATHASLRHHRFGINLSGESLRDATLLETIRQKLSRYRVPPTMLYFEITETAAISNLGMAVEFMRSLKQIGCQLALDDFGSGMSSFSYLKHLPVDYLKIDGSFVKDILNNPVDQAIVRAINSVGQKMGIRTIAEYVESPLVAEALREIGVDYAQGYGVAAPRPLEEFAEAFGAEVVAASA